MTTPLNRALLRWFHDHGAPTDYPCAHHVMHWSGAAALTACVTEHDYNTVATAMEVACIILQETQLFNVIGVSNAAELMINTPTGYTVEFNCRRVSLWKDGVLLAKGEIHE